MAVVFSSRREPVRRRTASHQHCAWLLEGVTVRSECSLPILRPEHLTTSFLQAALEIRPNETSRAESVYEVGLLRWTQRCIERCDSAFYVRSASNPHLPSHPLSTQSCLPSHPSIRCLTFGSVRAASRCVVLASPHQTPRRMTTSPCASSPARYRCPKSSCARKMFLDLSICRLLTLGVCVSADACRAFLDSSRSL